MDIASLDTVYCSLSIEIMYCLDIPSNLQFVEKQKHKNWTPENGQILLLSD